MANHTFHMSEKFAEQIHQLAKSHIASLHNYIASAVQRGDLPAAQKLVEELEDNRSIFAAFNMRAKHDIAEHTGKPLVIEHTVVPR